MSIEIKPHPKEVLELDEETVAVGKAKLAGIDFTEIYGDEDRSSPELMIAIQAKKIRDLFQNLENLKLAFSSETNKNQAIKDMVIDGINLDFIKSYCAKSQILIDGDFDALLHVGFIRGGADNGKL